MSSTNRLKETSMEPMAVKALSDIGINKVGQLMNIEPAKVRKKIDPAIYAKIQAWVSAYNWVNPTPNPTAGSHQSTRLRKPGTGLSKTKMSDDDVRAMRKLYDTGQYKQVRLAVLFGVSASAVSKIVNLEIRQEVV